MRAVLAVAMAAVTLFATGVAYLQQDASIKAAVAQREAQAIATTAMGDQVSSLARTTSDYGGFRRWFEALNAANWASTLQAETAPSHYDDAMLGGFVKAETAISKWATEHTDLLRAPYFDATTFVTNFAAYTADAQVAPQTRSTLQAEVHMSVASQWGGRASSYVTVLTLLAVSLFFFGLATTLTVRTRSLFVATALAFVLMAVGWTTVLATSSVARVTDSTIEDVVTARTELARVVNASAVGPIEARDRGRFEAALAAADRAIAAAPDYGAARLARADIAILYADGLFFRSDDPERMRVVLARSEDDYRIYLAAAGTNDYSAWWNLGWGQILSRDHAAALVSTEHALTLAPTHFALYLNRALARLEGGDTTGAEADTRQALVAARDSGLDSNGQFFLQAEFNIERLISLWPEHSQALTAMSRTLREGQVSLQVLHQATPKGDPTSIDATLPVRLLLQPTGAFVPEVYEDRYRFASGDSFAKTDANGVRVFIAGKAIEPGTMVSMRVWHDGRLDASSSADKPWTPVGTEDVRYMAFDVLSPYGRAGFDLEPGAYHLEIYLDGSTRSQLDWTVTP